MKTQPKVSVIIPVYNAEQYLSECINSLVNQTLHDIEIICIDDGSTDQSLNILRNFETKDSRIRIYTQQNSHAGVARNYGLQKANGEYIIFLDADDYFNLDLLHLTYHKAIETKADIVIFDALKFDTVTGEYFHKYHYLKENFLPQSSVFNCNDIPDAIFQITTPAPWTKLFRKSFLDQSNLQFQALLNTNDLYFVYSALTLADRITTINKQLVYYRTHTGTSLQSTKNKDPLCFIKAYQALYDTLRNKELFELVKRSFANEVISTAVYILEQQSSPDTQFIITEALASPSFRKTGYLNQPLSDYNYPEKVFLVRQYITRYTEQRLLAFSVSENVDIDRDVPLVSVIIPVYNMVGWMEDSIQSICQQTLNNIEIICINDGSTDHSLQILQRIAKEDHRIRVVSQPNGGLSAARNMGLKHAKGKYIYFFDSDDMLKPYALEMLYQIAETKQLDILLFDAESRYQTAEIERKFPEYKNLYTRNRAYKEVLTGEKMYTLMRQEQAYRCSVCLQFVRRKFVEDSGISFLNGILHEDELYSAQIMLKAKKVSHINEPLFIRNVHADSIVSSAKTFLNCYSFFRIYQTLLFWLEKENLPLSADAEFILSKWIKYLIQKTQSMYNALPQPQKRCAAVLPINQRILFEMLIIQQSASGTHPIQSHGQEPRSIGRILKKALKRILPPKSRVFIKKQLRRIPHKIKAKIKKIVKW